MAWKIAFSLFLSKRAHYQQAIFHSKTFFHSSDFLPKKKKEGNKSRLKRKVKMEDSTKNSAIKKIIFLNPWPLLLELENIFLPFYRSAERRKKKKENAFFSAFRRDMKSNFHRLQRLENKKNLWNLRKNFNFLFHSILYRQMDWLQLANIPLAVLLVPELMQLSSLLTTLIKLGQSLYPVPFASSKIQTTTPLTFNNVIRRTKQNPTSMECM